MNSAVVCSTFRFVLTAILCAQVICAYNILVFPLALKSHAFSLAIIAEGLADRGHNISFLVGENFRLNETVLKPRPEINVVRYKDSLDDGVPFDYDSIINNITRRAMETRANMLSLIPVIRKQANAACVTWTTQNNALLEHMKTERFDLVIIDGFLFTKCIYLVPHKLQVPWITYSDLVDPLIARVPWLPSFVPHIVLPYTESMSFYQRLVNFISTFVFSFAIPGPPSEIINKYQQYGSFSSADELMARSLLWLYPRDSFVLDYPHPRMPNMIEVGGLTVKPAAGNLSPDMRKFIEDAEKGVVLMTFGTIASSFPVAVAEKFLSAFRRLEGYRVIWRMRNTDALDIPDNVMISQWLPQNDILAHSNVKLFITHSGNNGQYEAVYHAVPMIGFPISGDQVYNAKRLDHRGYGLSMDLHDFTADQLLDNIHKILGDNSYKERVAKASEIFRSQAQSPVERATFWIEHVCRFGGDHLRSAGNDLPLYSYLMLDILAFMLFILHILVYLLYRLLKLSVNKCCGQTASNYLYKKND